MRTKDLLHIGQLPFFTFLDLVSFLSVFLSFLSVFVSFLSVFAKFLIPCNLDLFIYISLLGHKYMSINMQLLSTLYHIITSCYILMKYIFEKII